MKKPVKILLLVLLFLFAIGATFFITYHEAGALYRLEMSSGSSASLKTAEISSYLERYFIDDYDEKERILQLLMRRYTDNDCRMAPPAIRNVRVWAVKVDELSCRSFGLRPSELK